MTTHQMSTVLLSGRWSSSLFRRTYDEIIEMLVRTVLTAKMARDILRNSGWRPGVGSGGGDNSLGGLIPPGGNAGDVLWMDMLVGSGDFPTPAQYDPTWHKPSYKGFIDNSGYSAQEAEPYLGDHEPIILYNLALRNPDYTETGANDIPGTVVSANDGMTRQELLVWEDVPQGLWHYPFNVDWFVTKRELSVTGQYFPRQIKLRGTVAEGTPAADLQFKFSTDASSWTTLASASLSGGGPFNTGWLPFNEAASADVYLGLFIDAHSSISRLHMGPVEVLMRWIPRGPFNPEEFK